MRGAGLTHPPQRSLNTVMSRSCTLHAVRDICNTQAPTAFRAVSCPYT